MQYSRTFSILFWINTSRVKNNQAKIYARVTVNQKRANISLKYDVLVNTWDKNKSRVKGNTETAHIINHYLDQVQLKLFKCYQELNAEDKLITAQSIKAHFLGVDKKHFSMRNLIDYHNDKMLYKLHKDTMRHYKTSQKYIMLFIKKNYRTSDIYLKDLGYSFVIDFENFLRSYKPRDHQRKVGNNTIMKHIQRLRKMVTLAYHMEWIDRDPFAKFKPVLIKTERDFLSQAELQRIEDLPVSIDRLQVVKDLFVFSCYTGIAYGDIMLLTKDNIVFGLDGNKWIMTKRQKNGAPVKVPILPKAKRLIEKYKGHARIIENSTLFPKLSNQKLNSYLKEIADLCSITKNLTFHMARHTFATTVTLSNGVPIETVSKLLGHTKITTTQIYAKVIERKVSDDMEKLLKKFENSKTASN
ncbi:MAG: site-specific integrase [Flavobacteriaceae bacterium]|nr:site-specific integrase [Flavobacteriaceae bacterium]